MYVSWFNFSAVLERLLLWCNGVRAQVSVRGLFISGEKVGNLSLLVWILLKEKRRINYEVT